MFYMLVVQMVRIKKCWFRNEREAMARFILLRTELGYEPSGAKKWLLKIVLIMLRESTRDHKFWEVGRFW